MSLWLEPAVFPVLLDSCVLYPYELRDLLLEAAHRHRYRVHWSEQILQDTVRNLLADGRTTTEQAARFCSAMERAFPEAVVEPPAGLAEQLGCDPGDRHVLAAAIAAKAGVTASISGISRRMRCYRWGLRPSPPLHTMAARQRNPVRTAVVLLHALSRQAPAFTSRCMEFQVDAT